jgi:hypothetical protein
VVSSRDQSDQDHNIYRVLMPEDLERERPPSTERLLMCFGVLSLLLAPTFCWVGRRDCNFTSAMTETANVLIWIAAIGVWVLGRRMYLRVRGDCLEALPPGHRFADKVMRRQTYRFLFVMGWSLTAFWVCGVNAIAEHFWQPACFPF